MLFRSTDWSSFLDATRTCPVFSWLVSHAAYTLRFPHVLTNDLVGRLNRPGIMVYGGTIRPGSCEGAPQLDIVSAFQSYGKYLQDGKTEAAERERYNTIRHACPGPGACGGVCSASSPVWLEVADSYVITRCTQQIPWPVLRRPWV